MKLLRYGPEGQEKPGLLDETGTIRDLSGHVADFAGPTVALEVIDQIRGIDPRGLPAVEGRPRLGPPIRWMPNFHGIGLNYARHAAEAGLKPPTEPILFSKSTASLCGPDDPTIIPRGSVKTDWEVELGVVIGRRASHVPIRRALEHVAGYCVINDISERQFQMDMGGQWVKGKSAPSFGPIGPWLVTADEVPDPQALRIWLKLDGETMQDSTTADMIFGVAEIISYMSTFMDLLPGDVIATGTPEGVGMGMTPPRYLRPGDVMELGIAGLGVQRHRVVAFGTRR